MQPSPSEQALVLAELNLDGAPWPIYGPENRLQDAAWHDGARTLLDAAIGKYNASLRALSNGDVVRALSLAEEAVAAMPYCPHLVEYAAVLAIRHGDFEFAAKAVGTLKQLGVGSAATLRRELEREIARWNEVLSDPAYSGIPENGSYRFTRLRESTSLTAPGHTRPTNKKSSARLRRSVAGSAAGIWIGSLALAVTIGYWVAVQSNEAPPSEPPPDPPVPELAVQLMAALSEGSFADAVDHLATMRELADTEPFVELLEKIVADNLARQAAPYWRRGNLGAVYSNLKPLMGLTGTAVEPFYWLGIGAEAQGDTQLARLAFIRFLENVDGNALPHYRAQAAYSAARLSTGEVAVRYAALVANDYSETIYYNSRIRSILQDAD